MATYKGIRGITIQTVEGDIGTVQLGDIWYSNVTRKIRVGKTAAAAWSSGGNINNERQELAGTGDQTAALITGGKDVSPAITKHCEIYDGSSWTEIAELNAFRGNVAGNIGTTTAAIIAGGGPTILVPWTAGPGGVQDEVEEWNGTSWTEIADINTARYAAGGSGTVTAAVIFGGGGTSESPDQTVFAETWNGTSWTETADMSRPGGRTWFGEAGKSSTAAIAFGGAPGNQDLTETWDGSSWTEVADLNTGRRYNMGFGTSTLAVSASGYVTNAVVGNVEQWDGSSWAEVANVSTSRYNAGSAGTSAAGLIAGGDRNAPLPAPGISVLTEEWTGESTDAASVTSS